MGSATISHWMDYILHLLGRAYCLAKKRVAAVHTHIPQTLTLQDAKRNGQRVPDLERNHGSNLALPATKGGILVSLLRPPRNQTFHNSFTADASACRITGAVANLIAITSGGEITINDISTFDILLYFPEGTDEDELIKKAKYTFTKIVKAKEPDIILCCY